MAKKNWIFVKRGLSEDPKHRERIGECVWLFLHMIDRSDWETGIVYDWRDKDEASEMAMPLPTMRHQRQKLQELGYITCKQGVHKQDIVIHNWNNPRDYSGKVSNPKSELLNDDNHGDNGLLPYGDNHGDNHDDNHVSSQVITLPLDSLSSSSSPEPKKEPTVQKRGDMVDMYIDMMQSPGIKKSIRIDNIESYIQVKLGITPTRRSWKPFLEFIDNQQIKENHSLVTFVDWLTAQPKFDVSFWGPERMRENWDRAFINQSTITRVPGGAFYG